MADKRAITTVFLDRDGVINRLRSDYVLSWETFEFLPGAKDAIGLLNAASLRVVVVTNQRAVARGLLSEQDLERIHVNMRAELAASGARVDAIYSCPHEKGTCDCRKPDVGLFLRARQDEPAIDFGRSMVVGDSRSDLEAGAKIGARLVLVTNTGVRENTPQRTKDVEFSGLTLAGIAHDLADATRKFVLPATLSAE